MNSLLKNSPPKTEDELIERCQLIAGLTFSQLAIDLGVSIPTNPDHRKGWVGQIIELVLGCDAKNTAAPDFQELGIELKSLPISANGKPTESTFVTSIPLLTIHKESWQTSQCFAKLKRMLWIPIEGDRDIPYAQRRIGQGFLWSPSPSDESILANDWAYLTLQIVTGQLESVDATAGDYLQIRPKAADGKSLCYAFDAEGNKVKTLPRGFYLRSRFTSQILKQMTL